jgi:hypothetical protein
MGWVYPLLGPGVEERKTQSCFSCLYVGKVPILPRYLKPCHLHGVGGMGKERSTPGALQAVSTGVLESHGRQGESSLLSCSPGSLPGGGVCSHLTLKSMPTVAMKVPDRKAPSLNWIRKQVLPTPESPRSIT